MILCSTWWYYNPHIVTGNGQNILLLSELFKEHLLLLVAAGVKENWTTQALSPFQATKNWPVLCALKLFRTPPPLSESHRRECSSSWLIEEILSKMKENHHHGALMKSIFQPLMSLHFITRVDFPHSLSRWHLFLPHPLTLTQTCYTLTSVHSHACTRAHATIRLQLKTQNWIENDLYNVPLPT